MVFDILIILTLLALVVSHIYLAHKERENIDLDSFWLSINVGIQKLESRVKTIDLETKLQIKELNDRLEVHNTVVGDMGRQMIRLEDSLNIKFEEFSELSTQKAKEFEERLIKQISKAYRDHGKAIDKLSTETWSALIETSERLEVASEARNRLAESISNLKTEYRHRMQSFQSLIDANHQAFDEAKLALQSNVGDLSQNLEDVSDRLERDVQKYRVQSDKLLKTTATGLSQTINTKIVELSQSIDTKIISKEEETIGLVDKTKRSLEQALDREHSRLSEQSSKGISDLDSRFSEKIGSLEGKLESDIDNIGSRVGKEVKNLDARIEQTATDCGTLLTNIAQKIDKELTNLARHGNQLESEQGELGERIASIQDDLIQVKEKEGAFAKHVQRQNQITRNIENLVKGNNAFNYNTFKAFDRRFVRKDYEETIKPILDLFGLSGISFNTAGYLAHKICKIEETCVGRLATNIQDALIRLICVFGLKRKNAKILEIRTLFGINLCIVEELSSAYGKNLTYQVIDPLDGYYKSGELDIVTKQKIDNHNFWFNIKKCGLDPDKFKLIEGFSHHKRISNQILDRSIDLAFIDGDHTKKGVALDIRNYHPKLREGGYFLFDDYGSTQWPDVKEAVDTSRIIKTQYNFIGHAFRTAIYSKK